MWLYLNLSNLSHIVKSTHTVKASSCKECRRGICPKHQFGMIYEHYPPSEKESWKSPQMVLISSTAASRNCAKISQLQELEKAWKESEADYFLRSCDLSEKYVQNLFFSKTSQPLELGDLIPSSKNLPMHGMIVDGRCYQHRISERYIKERDGFFLPTLTASQASKPIRSPSPSRLKKNHGYDLQDKIGELHPKLIGMRINPQFLEWMMGFDLEWTELKPLEIL